jgi:hypothetical protein
MVVLPHDWIIFDVYLALCRCLLDILARRNAFEFKKIYTSIYFSINCVQNYRKISLGEIMSEKITVILKCKQCNVNIPENEANWLCLPGFDLEGLFCKDCIVENITKSLSELKS